MTNNFEKILMDALFETTRAHATAVEECGGSDTEGFAYDSLIAVTHAVCDYYDCGLDKINLAIDQYVKVRTDEQPSLSLSLKIRSDDCKASVVHIMKSL